MPAATRVRVGPSFGERVWFDKVFLVPAPEVDTNSDPYYTSEKVYDPFNTASEELYRLLNTYRDSGTLTFSSNLSQSVIGFENNYWLLLGAPGSTVDFSAWSIPLEAGGRANLSLQAYDVSPDSEFDGKLIVDFIGGASGRATSEFLASRDVVFPFVPQRPVREVVEYETSILEAWDGTEQRSSIRPNGRVTYRHSYILDTSDSGQQVQTARLLLSGVMGREVFFGMWHQANISTGATVVALNVEFGFIRDNPIGMRGVASKLMLWKAWDDYIIVSVDPADVEKNKITLLAADVPIGFRGPGVSVVEVRPGIARDGVRYLTAPAETLEVEVDWLCERSHGDDGSATSRFTSTYESAPIMQEAHQFEDGRFRSGAVSQYIQKDTKTGPRKFILRRNAPAPEYDKLFSLTSAPVSEVDSLKTFLLSLQGRRVSFWFPTNLDDLSFDTTYTPSANPTTSLFIRVQDSGIGKYLQNEQPYDVVRITNVTTATEYYRRIISSSTALGTAGETGAADTDRILFLDDTVTWNNGDVVEMCFMHKARLGSDSLNFIHNGSGDVEISLPIIGVKQGE